MEKGLNMKWLGMIFAFCLLISTFGSGNMPQIDNISSTIESSFGIDPLITSILMSALIALVIIGGIKRISSIAASIVPLMAFIYFVGGLSVLIFNYENIIPSLIIIFDVFEGTSVVGGFWALLFLAFTYGVLEVFILTRQDKDQQLLMLLQRLNILLRKALFLS